MSQPTPNSAPPETPMHDASIGEPSLSSDPNSSAPETDRRSAAVSQVAPDFIEQELQEGIDNVVPTRGYEMIPMVALGGSAGSIQPLQAFFRAMPPNSGMVFVVILHLSPDHHSTLAELLGLSTQMRVTQAEDGQKVEANHVYVIPPGKHLATVDGHLRLFELQHERGKRVAVDLFFRSLADTHGPHAIAIVLSGAASDGAIGIKRMKERGGLTIAQDPEEAEHDGMPRSAIATGMVDWVLHVDQIPHRLIEYRRNELELELPSEDGPPPAQPPPTNSDASEAALRDVLAFLRTRTGRDFTYYKRATILRRIARRMQINGVVGLQDYLIFLRTRPGECAALLQDMLISVTNFFRDRESFTALEQQVIPALFKGKGPDDTVRVWVPACATGEEAYSVTMLLLEHARGMIAPPTLQIFACDLDEEAIQEARAGLYSEAIAADVSEERLARFFVKESGGYRVRREVRELVLFAVHDLLRDAPFSRIDLVSCRNLLIYLNRDAQSRVLEIFHFALKPQGRLFLGSSETVDEHNPLFRVLDKKYRLYVAQVTARSGLPVFTGAGTLRRIVQAHERAGAEVPVIHGKAFAAGSLPFRPEESPLDRLALAELHVRLTEKIAPPSVVIDSDHRVVHLSAHAGKYLRFTAGEPTNDLLRLIDPALRMDLRAAVSRAAETGEPVEITGAILSPDGRSGMLDVVVSPAPDLAPGYLLVSFGIPAPERNGSTAITAATATPAALQFERELDVLKEQLRDTVEQYEASNEEMKASNEELQAMNEELRSASEELETSREELQSINEELVTINQEMKGKVDELAHTNGDLQNLMAATSIATVFLDRELCITRYTPSMTEFFYVIAGDVGRPLSHIKHRLDYPGLFEDSELVLRTLVPVEREVRSDKGCWYLVRFLPYRTLDDHIAGVVMTFVDVTDRKRAQQALADDLAAGERLRKTSERLVPDGDMQALYDEILEAAVVITGAASGTLQLLDPDARELHLLAVVGFSAEMAARFETVTAGTATSCGVALATGRNSEMDFDAPGVIDVDGDLRAHLDAGLLSAQSTLLVTRGGLPIGMLTTHWREHRRLSDRERRFLDLLVRQAADAVERQLAGEFMREHMDELTRFNDASVGRETRMIELKAEINTLLAEQGKPPRHLLEFDGDQSEKSIPADHA